MLPRSSNTNSKSLQWALLFILVSGAIGCQPAPVLSAQEYTSKQFRSSFWALSTALADYQMDHDQRFPEEKSSLKPYLIKAWQEAELLNSVNYVTSYAGKSLKTIPVEELERVPVFLQTKKAADGTYYAWYFDARMVELSEDELEHFSKLTSPLSPDPAPTTPSP